MRRWILLIAEFNELVAENRPLVLARYSLLYETIGEAYEIGRLAQEKRREFL